VQRFGLAAELIDPFGQCAAIDAPSAVRRLLDLLRPHADALDCLPEIEQVETILSRGTSADRQVAIYEAAIKEGCDEQEGLRRVNAWLQRETLGLETGFRCQVSGFREQGQEVTAS
jgi:carboxylate-amine ligase